ncbi:restriction endonuclease subunit S [Vibrio parahaemolyticus]|nr:restriction endonuclease subunit S [Vibrio parahaemolyticus]EKA6055775.1 restriction endonuclease subunit S [Vibrio parahaemolyticus]EKA6057543.1 restriction endonuclease subunit S [Vibrio parahaemolyticus]ELB2730472.1 restriction endonuclease subunit S [Vibrio parahaemolyticus]
MNQLQIPNGWLEYSLKDLADPLDKYSFKGGPFGSDLKSAHYTTAGVRVLQLQDIGEGVFLNKSDIYTSDEKADELLASNIYPGDILLAKMAPVARCCIVPDESPRYVMCSDGIRLAVNKQMFDRDYVFHSLNAPTFREKANALSTGTTRARIGLSDLKALTIYCPTLPEQQKIAEVLSTVDKKIDLIDQKIVETEKLKTGLMQKLFSEGVGVQDENGEWQPHTDFETVEGSQIPKGWLKTTLSQVIKVKSGDSLSKKNMEEGCIPVFGGNGISGYHSKPNFNSPQLVIGRVGEYCGAVHITPEKSWITDNALLVTETLINVSFEFLYYLLVSVDLNKYASRNAQPLVSGRTLNLVTIKVPQEAEQYEIVNILSTVDKKLTLLNRQMEETRSLKKGLMQKLLTGEWRVPVEETEAA